MKNSQIFQTMGQLLNYYSDTPLDTPIRLSDICEVVRDSNNLHWALLEIDGIGEPPNFDSMQHFEDEVRYGDNNRWHTWQEIKIMSEWSIELHWAWLVGLDRKKIEVEAFEGVLGIRNRAIEFKVLDRETMSVEFCTDDALSLAHAGGLAKLQSKFSHVSRSIYP